MSTLGASMTDPDEQTHHSESELTTIGDLVVWHQMPFFSVRRLTQLNCPRWSMWDSSNLARISKARTLDDTRDWYFPIFVKKEKRVTQKTLPEVDGELKEDLPSPPVKDVWSSWSGVWHSSAQHASDRALPLPPMTHLPHEWLHFRNPRDDVIASAGGLLLIKGTHGMVPVRRSKRLNPELADSNPSSISSRGRTAQRRLQSWKRLLVCNPLTRECRELPTADCRQLPGMVWWDFPYWRGVQARLVVDEEANCYQVILTLGELVAVYSSTIDSWNCLLFPEERPWGRLIPNPSSQLARYVRWEYICASARMAGHLYFADVQSTTAPNRRMQPTQKATIAATLRLFEVNVEAGKWEPVQQYPLRKFHIPSLKYADAKFAYDMNILKYLEITECMGGLYAVLPAKIHDAWLIGEEPPHGSRMPETTLDGVDESGRLTAFMPLCFYIMQLQGDEVDCGVLRIQVPLDRCDYRARVRRLKSLASGERWFPHNWFSCEARGSVIWVACEDYVLSFDVMSRESKTQIISLDRGGTDHTEFGDWEKLGFTYRPSLHMKP